MLNFVYFSQKVFLHVYIISISDTEYEIIHFHLAQNCLLKNYNVEKNESIYKAYCRPGNFD